MNVENLRNLDPSQWVLITHRDCMDGSTAGLLWTVAGGENIVYVHPFEADEVYREWKQKDTHRVIFVDVAPQSEGLRPQDVVLDHHVSNAGRFADNTNAFVDLGGCGCRHLFDALLSDGVLNEEGSIRSSVGMLRNLVGVVDDYDRHLQQRPVAGDLALYHEALGAQDFVRCFVAKLLRGMVERTYFWSGNVNDFAILSDEDRRIVRALRLMSDRYVSDVVRNSWSFDDVQGHRIVCVFADQGINTVCDALLEANPDCAYALVVDLKRGSVSFRSRTDEDDCTQLIKSLGIIGGGHARAAGARIPEWMWHELRAQIGV